MNACPAVDGSSLIAHRSSLVPAVSVHAVRETVDFLKVLDAIEARA